MIAALAALLFASAASPTKDAAVPAAGPRPVVALAEVTGSIDPGSGAYLLEAIHEAERSGVEALVVRLDTPGGLLSTTREVVQAELSAKVPVVFWVAPPGARAGSAGVFLTLAAHVAAMAPSSNIGAAHPVTLGGGKDKDEGPSTLETKIENDTAAFVHGIAERRSRNIEWAEKAVRESVSITASEALQEKVIDLLAEDLPELLRKLDGRSVDLGGGERHKLRTAGAEVRAVEWPVRLRLLHGLADPEVAYLIAMLGVIGLVLELFHPGTIVPGVVGVICLVVAAIAFQMLPVNLGAALLVLLGAGFFVAELYVGGHGGFIAAGAVCVVIGSLLLFGHATPEYFADEGFGIGWRTVAPVGLALATIAFLLVGKLGQSARGRPRTGDLGLLGETGEVREEIGARPGRVLVHGELWIAESDEFLPVGARARVVAVRGLTLDVAKEKA